MKQYVTLDKRSKKAQREYYAKQRTTWGELNPVTRSVPSGKAYNRKKEKQRIGVEFRNGFDADFLRSLSDLLIETEKVLEEMVWQEQLTNMVPYRALAGFFNKSDEAAEWGSIRRLTAYIERINRDMDLPL